MNYTCGRKKKLPNKFETTDDAHVKRNYDSDEHVAYVLEHTSDDGEIDITWDSSTLKDVLSSDQTAVKDYAEQNIPFF